MQIATTNQPSSWFTPKPKNRIKLRKNETMLIKFLRKFFWMNKPNHGHEIQHLSNHLKRDMGLIEQDLNPRPHNKENNKVSIQFNIWI